MATLHSHHMPAPTPRPCLVDPARGLTLVALWLLLALFVIYPLLMMLSAAFLEDGRPTIAPLLAILAKPGHRSAFLNSLLLGLLVGLLGTALGFLFAVTVSRAHLRPAWTRLIDAATLLPLISPPFTTSISFIFSFGPRGLITYDLLGIKGANVYGLTSTLAAEVLTYFPIAYLTLRPVLSGISGNLEEMAFSLGSRRLNVFRTVTLPLAVPGLANAFLLLFAASLADFATPLILAGNAFPVLPTEAYLQITGLFDLKGGAILSVLLLLPAAIVYLLQRSWVARGHYVTITGKAGPQSSIRSVTPAARLMLVVSCAAVALFILYLYGLLVFASVVAAFGADHSWTLRHYQVIFTEGRKAIIDTLIIALLGMPLGGLYGVLVGYLVARGQGVGRYAMEVVSMVNYALPGTIVGIAYLIAFNDPPIALTGTAVIIVACYVFRYSPAGIRTTVALLQQIDKGLEEASSSLGARSSTTFRRVTFPLVMPAFLAGVGVVFVRSMTAISATIFLVSIGWTLITVRILENMTELSLGPAAAFSVLVIVAVMAVMAVLNAILRRLPTATGEQMQWGVGGG
ncbi:MAG TPA: iron ABC transporter permease [Hyphomicrobiaceae bacterium]|nr:iron ABC transporter permease [Hyphomicrobiaceae bacterium]